MPFLGKSLSLCDFFEFCELEGLILVKKAIEQATEVKSWKGVTEQSIKKLEEDIERQISLKNSETFNDHVVTEL